MLGEFPGNTWHVCWTPCKYVPVLTEKFDERAFLCGVQAGGHIDRLGSVSRMYLMCSSIVGGAEGPVDCLLLVLWHERAVVGYHQIGHCRLHAKSLGDFAEFTIAQVRFLKITFTVMTPFGPGIFNWRYA